MTESDNGEESPKHLKTKINIIKLAIPAIGDAIGCCLMYIALTIVAASVYQMMRGIIVVITALMSVIFLHRKQYAHHFLSLFLIVLGVAIVGVVSIAYSKDSDKDTTSGFGILLLLASQCFIGVQYITEEYILEGYYLDPFFLVGIEGFWGCMFFLVLLPIFQQVKNCTS